MILGRVYLCSLMLDRRSVRDFSHGIKYVYTRDALRSNWDIHYSFHRFQTLGEVGHVLN